MEQSGLKVNCGAFCWCRNSKELLLKKQFQKTTNWVTQRAQRCTENTEGSVLSVTPQCSLCNLSKRLYDNTFPDKPAYGYHTPPKPQYAPHREHRGVTE